MCLKFYVWHGNPLTSAIVVVNSEMEPFHTTVLVFDGFFECFP